MNVELLSAIERNRAELIERYKREKDWYGYIFAHERYDRLAALWDVLQVAGLEKVDVWPLVSSVWIDAEGHIDVALWTFVWNLKFRNRKYAMSEEERNTLAAMPSKITVYRGYNDPDKAQGLSWTTNRDQAVWFAKRWAKADGPAPTVVEGQVLRGKVIAYLNGRKEDEIVVEPKHIRIIKVAIAVSAQP